MDAEQVSEFFGGWTLSSSPQGSSAGPNSWSEVGKKSRAALSTRSFCDGRNVPHIPDVP